MYLRGVYYLNVKTPRKTIIPAQVGPSLNFGRLNAVGKTCLSSVTSLGVLT